MDADDTLGWLVLQLSNNSGLAVGLVIALQYLPTLLFGVWGGVITGAAFDKRKVMIITQTCMTAIAGLLTIVVLADVVQLWMIYVIVIANGLALAVDNPTRQSFVVEFVGPEDLSNAVGLTSALFQNGASPGTGPGDRRGADRRGRHRRVLPVQLAVVRRGDRRPRDAAAVGTAPRQADRAGQGPGARRTPVHLAHT